MIEKSPLDLPALFKSTGKEIVGNSDCGNLLFLEEIMDTFPNTKLVIIERPLKEVILSMEQLGEDFAEREAVFMSDEILQYAKTAYDSLLVDFHKMDAEMCKLLWEYCIGTNFDVERWKMLDGMNIEMIPEKKIEQLERLH